MATLRGAGYNPTAIREMAGIAGLGGIVNRIGTMLAVPIEATQGQRGTDFGCFAL